MVEFRPSTADCHVGRGRFARSHGPAYLPLVTPETSQVKRCDEMARRLRFFADQVAKEGITPAAHVTTHSSASSGSGGAHPTQELDELESRLEELERELLSLNESTERLDRTYYELVELEVRSRIHGTGGGREWERGSGTRVRACVRVS